MGWAKGTVGAAAMAAVRPYYDEPFRLYHGLAHPVEMLDVAEARGLALGEAQCLAIAFHDVVNAAGAPDGVSEEASAAILLAYAPHIGVAPDVAREAAGIVVATDHSREPATASAAPVLDLDLLRLALPYEAFLAHSEGVRREWEHLLPDRRAFMAGRARFLSAFASRPAIYRTGLFDEAMARSNIRRFVEEWG